VEAAPTGVASGEAGDLDRVWTLPNVISLARIVLLGVFCWLLFGPDRRILATAVLMVVGVTDFLDGYVARRFHQVSTLGKVLDPVADRLVLVTGVIAIAVYGAVPAWLAAIVIGRELLVSVAVLALAALGARRIDVLWVGKAGTFGLLCCFPLFLLGDESARWARVLTDVTWVGVVPALLLSFAAAAAYVPHARQALRATNR
jgi:cardiolipin synthase